MTDQCDHWSQISIQFNSLFLVNHFQPSMFYPACRQCPHNRGPRFTIHNSIQQSPTIQSPGLCEKIARSKCGQIWALMWSLYWKQKGCKYLLVTQSFPEIHHIHSGLHRHWRLLSCMWQPFLYRGAYRRVISSVEFDYKPPIIIVCNTGSELW